MVKPITIVFSEEAEHFFDGLDLPVRQKFREGFYKVENGMKGKWFEKLVNTDDIFEFRVAMKNNNYRLFAFWDSTGVEKTLIICTHGLLKKTNKTPKTDILKAEGYKIDYFANL